MSRIRFQSKQNGRAMLRGHWLQAIAIFLILGAMTLALSLLEDRYRAVFHEPVMVGEWQYNLSAASLLITAVFLVLSVLFTQPLSMGQTEWYWKLSGGRETRVGDVFAWFGSFQYYLKSLGLWLNIFVRFLLWTAAVCAIPFACIWTSIDYFLPKRSQTTYLMAAAFLLVFGLLLLLVAAFALLLVAMRYFLAPYLMVEDNTRRIREIVRASVRYSRNYRWEMLKFTLSFLPWFLICYFVLPLLYVWPYYSASCAVLARHIILTARADGQASGGEGTAAE